MLDMFNVVYAYMCAKSNAVSYVGMTTRPLVDRIREHRLASSPIGSHILGCDKCANSDFKFGFKVLAMCKDFTSLRIAETIKIEELKPCLNTQLVHSGASFLLRIMD